MDDGGSVKKTAKSRELLLSCDHCKERAKRERRYRKA